MAIKSVTTENLAEFARSRVPPAELSTGEQVTEEVQKPTPGNPVITAGEEKLDGTPEPSGSGEPKKPNPKKEAQARIDELTREKHELDEAFQAEYESRLRLEGELDGLRKAQKPIESPIEPEKELQPPDPQKYTDQSLYNADLKRYQDAIIDARVAVKLREEREAEWQRQQDIAMAKKVAQAKKDFEDFQVVINTFDQTKPVIAPHIQGALQDSDVGAHLAYHLAKFPEDRERIFALTPAKAVLELGKLELQYLPKEKAAQPTPPLQGAYPPETTRAPAPLSKLKDSATVESFDASKPMPFKEYKRHVLEQQRQGMRKHH